MATLPIVPGAPTPKMVQQSIDQWKAMKNSALQESCLVKLFRTYPRNDSAEDVLLKVSTLNTFYSTNIFNPYEVARHIVSMKIDRRLAKGDLGLIEPLASVVIGGKRRRFYSFTSKYCAHHRPEKYSIYDQYVDKMLAHFDRRDDFASFSRPDLKNYPTFCAIIDRFRDHYQLTKFSRREIDIYLWIVGREAFRNKRART